MLVQDQLQRELYLQQIPTRIVSLVPSQTELLVALGLEENIVGVTKFCVHPSHLRKATTVVGGTKKVHIDKIKALQPHVILCNKEENTREMVKELEEIAPVHVSDIISIEDSLELIEMYGELFEKEEKAKSLRKDIRAKKLAFQEKTFPSRRVAYFIWRNPWMAAGDTTFINTLLKLNHWENVYSFREGRYPETSLEELKALAPEVVLLSSEPFPFKEKHIREIEQAYNCKVMLVDGEYFSWYGSRLLAAFSYFTELQEKLDP